MDSILYSAFFFFSGLFVHLSHSNYFNMYGMRNDRSFMCVCVCVFSPLILWMSEKNKMIFGFRIKKKRVDVFFLIDLKAAFNFILPLDRWKEKSKRMKKIAHVRFIWFFFIWLTLCVSHKDVIFTVEHFLNL